VLPSSSATFWPVSQYLGLAQPSIEVRGHFADKGQSPPIKAVKKMTIATIVFVECPGFHFNPVGSRAVDQIDRDL
jgi:hypothetical protein